MGLTLLQPTIASRASDKIISVEVVNSSNHRAIKDTRVFVLSVEGQELASATTDDHGLAALPRLEESQHPKYIVVEHPAFFLSGMRWQAGMEEYYILATVLTVR
jgi:uncharacterized protein YfaS (alpha-2-macroglobulin family)